MSINVNPDYPEHYSHAFGCHVRSRRHFRELQKIHGTRDFEEGEKVQRPVRKPEWRTDLWTTARLASEAGVKERTAIAWREGRHVAPWLAARLVEAERREFYTKVRNQEGLEDRLRDEGHRL